MDFLNKTALITGAAVGIGRAVALKFAKEGAKVVAVDLNEEKLASLQKEIENISSEKEIKKKGQNGIR